MSSIKVFNKKNLKVNPSQYIMGVDTYDKDIACYCLMKKTGDSTEILLSKRMRKSVEFTQEVENLSKYFNAITLKDY
jgi:hypothetical protein